MRILYYCQHVLGMGHFLRSLEIIKALKDHEVVLVTGGPEVGLPIPNHVRLIQLPPLMMDENFRQLLTASAEDDLETVKRVRAKRLREVFQAFAPDVFVIELYPFGRNAFRFELKPILEGIRSGELPPCRVACSLRDILVEKNDPVSYEKRAIDVLAAGFDALLVHSDPIFIRLEETFSRVEDIPVPIEYTGFITPKPDASARARVRNRLGLTDDDRLIVASIGGGKAGGALLSAVVKAIPRMNGGPRLHAEVFAGPFMDQDEFERLESLSGSHIHIARFTDDFIAYLAASDLSVSMAGYNTSLNVLAAGARALFWPFTQNREQPRRAAMLAGLGVAGVLQDEELDPSRLAVRMDEVLSGPPPAAAKIDLSGAEHTARWLTTWAEQRLPLKQVPSQFQNARKSTNDLMTCFERIAAEALASSPKGRGTVFFRADDIGVPSGRFERLIRLFRHRSVPLDLAVVPAWLTRDRWERLKRLVGTDESLFGWHQHGWQHRNHEAVGKKSEFGSSRSKTEIRGDIEKGRARLQDIMGESFWPVFTPPWNRCAEDALTIISEAGYWAVSRFFGARPGTPAGFKDWHADVDLHTRKETSESLRLDGIFREMEQGMARGRCGFMIHHRLMGENDFHFLDKLLQTLSRINELHVVNYKELKSVDQLNSEAVRSYGN